MALPKRFSVEPLWQGKRAVILGGGPSLSLKQIRTVARARNRPASDVRVVAINDAIYGAWWADWHHACDATWWREHIQNVHTFPGIKTTLDETIPEPWVTGYLQNTGPEGFDEDPSCCRTGANGVYQAIHMMIHAGVRQIILLGVDMKKGPNGESHWFGEHPKHFCSPPAPYQTIMTPRFPALLPVLESRKIDVVNASPGTALETFRKEELEKLLVY